jgi:hypothetical protein
MEALAYKRVTEKGQGWYHALTVKTDSGHLLTIVDDTDDITATANSQEVTSTEVAAIWDAYGMGRHSFPSLPVPAGEVQRHLPELIWRGAGVQLITLVPVATTQIPDSERALAEAIRDTLRRDYQASSSLKTSNGVATLKVTVPTGRSFVISVTMT